MDILEAIQTRHSVRDFLSRPVPKEVVMDIMAAARRSPSGGNGQPWEVFVASGATLEAIRQAYQERARGGGSGPGGPPPGPGGSPPPPYIQERMATIRNERLRLLGLDPADPASLQVFGDWGARLYGAPVLAVICMDAALSSFLDIGLLVQTVCLAAQHFEVDSMIAGALVAHPDILRQELDIPANLAIVIGVGLGYANPEGLINTYRSPRRPLEEVVRYKG